MTRKVQHRALSVLAAVIGVSVALTVGGPVAVQAATQTVFSDGFESGNLAAWTTSAGFNVQSSLVRTGTWAGRATTSGSAGYASATLGVARTDVTMSANVNVVSTSTAVTLLRLRTGTGSGIVSLKVNAADKLLLRNEVASVNVASTTAMPAGWHLVTLHVIVAGAGSTVEVRLDGALVQDLSSTTMSLGTNPVGRVQVGTNGSSTGDVAFDDVLATTEVQDRTDPVITAAGDICLAKPGSCKGTANLVLSLNPDAALTLGDNQYPKGTLSQYLASYETTWGRFKTITMPAPGNHEWYTPNAQGYRNYFADTVDTTGGLWYSYNLGSWHLVSLDSECAETATCGAGSQYDWLQDDLQSDSQPCTLAYWHHPRFSSGADHGNDPDVSPLWDLLIADSAELVLNGHDHDYELFAPQTSAGSADASGLREFVVGTGGTKTEAFAAPQPNSLVRITGSKGVLELTLMANSYSWRFIAVGGAVLDSGTDTCH
jgi:hypothetical protein